MRRIAFAVIAAGLMAGTAGAQTTTDPVGPPVTNAPLPPTEPTPQATPPMAPTDPASTTPTPATNDATQPAAEPKKKKPRPR